MTHPHRQPFKLQFLQRLWQVARPYWTSSEKWRAWGLLLLLLLLSIVSAGLLVVVSIFLGDVTSALVAQDSDRFWQSVFIFIGVILVGVPLLSLKIFVQAQLSLYWRRWLTQEMLQRYFSNRQFYKLSQVNHHYDRTSSDIAANIDNPDQRIAEDINTFTEQALFFLIAFLDSCLQLMAFVGVLWAISKPLMAFLVAYAMGGTMITGLVFGRKLIYLNVEQLKREANFRFGLVRVRENTEAIALYDGQAQELSILQQRFQSLFDNFNHLIRWQLGLNFFQNGYQYLTFLLPALILSGPILNGTMEVGVQSQAVIAFRSILIALAVIIQQFEKLAEFMARGDRLHAFRNAMLPPHLSFPISPSDRQIGDRQTEDSEKLEIRHKPSRTEVIQTIEAPYIALDHLTLYTPDRSTELITDLSLTVEPGQSLLVQGPSGVGKSSLLRAIAGLWETGSGTIRRPPLDQIVFLPQRPYMALGTLRQQLMYPVTPSALTGDESVDEELLQHILEQVNLPFLKKQYDGWDSIENWSQILSVGEQQRLAIARLLVTRSLQTSIPTDNQTKSLISPIVTSTYAILDEATSALDQDNEDRLYQTLFEHSITYISVGHRPNLQRYHHHILTLDRQEP
ncbi:MAG: ABC transporter ATP-binding protein/permease [Cyanobacteria bacterium P01_F01_bin.150]